ncbi:MAG: hypothetical protein RI554_06285, partial [Trueperaceae bacterium]|nr:hypothetical protein [Trueperaceae bacterium]
MSDAPRPDGDDAPRREAPPAIGITRMCLKSGGVQVPHVLAGRLPEGEVAAYDADADAPLTLYAEPPRRLEGLEAYFERHDVEVNDELLVDLDGDVVTLSLRKRPRRDVPDVTPSTWTSLREPTPAVPAPDPAPPAGAPPEAGGDAFASLDAGDPDPAMLTGEAPEPLGWEDDVPRAPRVRSHPEGRDVPPPPENDPFAWTEDVD